MSETKVAVVTGAGSGIGKAVSLKLASDGYIVALFGRRVEKLEGTAEDIKSAGGEAKAFSCDVGDEESVENAVKEVKDAFGRCDVLINNAGITRDGLFIRMKPEDFDAVIRTNLTGAFLMTKAVVPMMIKNRWGRIVNVSSVVGLSGNMGQANYASSKAGLFGLTKSCALEFSRRNITVNALAPGFVGTEMTQDMTEEQCADILSKVPLKRFGSPEEIADLIGFLSSDSAGYITGEVIRIDGGMGM